MYCLSVANTAILLSLEAITRMIENIVKRQLIARSEELQKPFSRLGSLLAIALVICFSISSIAEEKQIPPALKGLGVNEQFGKNIDLNLSFTDEDGKAVQLKEYFKGDKPVILSLVYYSCPSLCNLILNAQLDAYKKMPWSIGDQYRVVTVSIDPREKPELAKRKKASYLEEYGRSGSEKDWHFLVSKEANVRALAKQVGFNYKWVEDTQQYAHGSVFFVLTPEGKISRYIYGLSYEPTTLKYALVEAGEGRVGTVVDRLLLFCFHYDASQKKYVVVAKRVVTAGASLTLFLLTGFIGMLWFKDRQQRKRQRG